jgi:ketosteroid isomerase-like protein
MSVSRLPSPIAAFLDATKARDPAALLASFTDDAVLTDMGESHRGEAIRHWNDRLFLGANVTVHPIDLVQREGSIVVTVMVDGDYQSFGITKPFQLDWWFSIRDDKIASLRMAQEKTPDVPPPVCNFIVAVNAFDIDGLMAGFAESALVNDQRREYRGKDAIRDWATREIIGDRVTVNVTQAVWQHGNVTVTASVNGDYDKTNLPNPLVLTFYFSMAGDEITQLIILHNKPVT